MPLKLVKHDDAWRLGLSGVLDIFDAGPLHAAALEAVNAGVPVVADLRQAESVDTAVTQILLALRQQLAEAGRPLTLEGVPPSVAAVWQDIGLATQLS
jgi:anti-anti-sigma regulatory factor